MKLIIHAVGRMSKGPERDLFLRYIKRVDHLGKTQGVHLTMVEHQEGRCRTGAERKRKEAALILREIRKSDFVVALDENGDDVSSRRFHDFLLQRRNQGTKALCFIIGSADGLDQSIMLRANKQLSLGLMTWPHQLVRAMLAEQVYRSLSILCGLPYNRS